MDRIPYPTARIRRAMRELARRQTPVMDDDGRPKVVTATCGHCGGQWNDAAISDMTPTPSARCPFEYDHEYDDD